MGMAVGLIMGLTVGLAEGSEVMGVAVGFDVGFTLASPRPPACLVSRGAMVTTAVSCSHTGTAQQRDGDVIAA